MSGATISTGAGTSTSRTRTPHGRPSPRVASRTSRSKTAPGAGRRNMISRRSRPATSSSGNSRTSPASRCRASSLNMRRPQFQDRRVRQALTLAYNFEIMNRTLFYGLNTRTDSYFEGQDLASSGLPTGKELELLSAYKDKLPPELFTQPFKLPVYDSPQAERQYLKQAVDAVCRGRLEDQRRQDAQRQGRTVQDGDSRQQPDRRSHLHHLYREPAQDRHRRLAAHRRPGQYVNRYRNFDFDMRDGAAGAVVLARQRTARVLDVQGRRYAGLAQSDGHQGSGRRRADRAGDLRHRPRRPAGGDPRARSRAPVELLRGAAIPPPRDLDRLLEQVRHPGKAARLSGRRHRIPGGSIRPRRPRCKPNTRARIDQPARHHASRPAGARRRGGRLAAAAGAGLRGGAGEPGAARPVCLRRPQIPARIQAFRLRQSRGAEGRAVQFSATQLVIQPEHARPSTR